MSRLVAAAVLVLSAGYAYAQFPRDFFGGYGALRGEQGDPAELPPAEWPDRQLAGCHILYSSVRREANGNGWRTDYPWGQRNLLIRLSEMTKTRVSKQNGVPHVWLVRLTDPALFECSFLMASDVGTIGLSEPEAAALRQYLMKGGFLWVDDFWGEAAWEHWVSQIEQVLPRPDFLIEDVALTDPMLHAVYPVDKIPQITNILFWRRNDGLITSERYDSEEAHLRVIRDASGRVMVVMTHNTDVADSWEREGEDPGFFQQFSPQGYALGIDVVMHLMTH